VLKQHIKTGHRQEFNLCLNVVDLVGIWSCGVGLVIRYVDTRVVTTVTLTCSRLPLQLLLLLLLLHVRSQTS